MATIIHAPVLATASRQLRRAGMPAIEPAPAAAASQREQPAPGVGAAEEAPLAPAPEVAAHRAIPAAPAPQPLALELEAEAQRLREQAAALELRAQTLAIAESALQQQLDGCAQREQQLKTAQQQLQDEAGTIREEAERRGHAQGLQQGEDAARELASAQVARLNSLVQAMQQARGALFDEHEDMLVEISFAAVCRVLGAQAATRAGLASLVGSLIEGERALEQLSVRLHPQDMQLLAADRGGLDARLQLEPDQGVALGGCLIESPRGTLDARLELQMAQLRAALLAARQLQRQEEAPV